MSDASESNRIVDEAVATMAKAKGTIIRLRATVSIMESTLEGVREYLAPRHLDDREAARVLALVEEAIAAAKRAP